MSTTVPIVYGGVEWGTWTYDCETGENSIVIKEMINGPVDIDTTAVVGWVIDAAEWLEFEWAQRIGKIIRDNIPQGHIKGNITVIPYATETSCKNSSRKRMSGMLLVKVDGHIYGQYAKIEGMLGILYIGHLFYKKVFCKCKGKLKHKKKLGFKIAPPKGAMACHDENLELKIQQIFEGVGNVR